MMKKIFLVSLLAIVFGAGAAFALSPKDPMAGGSAMSPHKNIVENVTATPDYATLATAIMAGGLVETLEGPGPFTVFAPTNEAFAKLPSGEVDTLLKPESKENLVKLLTYHIVPGRLRSKDMKKMVKRGKGKATLKTVQGEELGISLQNGKIVITDAKGNQATVTVADVLQSNGVIHGIDAVLMPN
jgi:uncharacterized surface protein with fasciclin (FAS1) repeats